MATWTRVVTVEEARFGIHLEVTRWLGYMIARL